MAWLETSTHLVKACRFLYKVKRLPWMKASKEEPCTVLGFLRMLPAEQELMGYLLGQQHSSEKSVFSARPLDVRKIPLLSPS